MKWYVFGTDGETYGPASLEMLRCWAMEGRLLRTSALLEAGSARILTAADLAELWCDRPPAGSMVCGQCGRMVVAGPSLACTSCGAPLYASPDGDPCMRRRAVDATLGFLVGIGSFLLCGVGVIFAWTTYLGCKDRRPLFAMGIRTGLITGALALVGIVTGLALVGRP